jgi:hypothetical protein
MQFAPGRLVWWRGGSPFKLQRDSQSIRLNVRIRWRVVVVTWFL